MPRHTISHTRRTGTGAAAAAALACLVANAAPAAAVTIPLPQGEACSDFAVTLDIEEDGRNSKTFVDRNGDDVVLLAGRANSVVLTNTDDGLSVSLPARGALTRTTTHADGTTTYEYAGSLLLVLFSTDEGGAGLTPTSTTLIVGRTVFTVDPDGVYTVQSVAGRTTDVCELLSP